jgi:hypothetical protein
MKSVFEASTGLEAHMILNLLQQAGIEGRVEGEYLQGGLGELQALNLVRVMVDDIDYEAARSILAEWEARQPKPERRGVQQPKSTRPVLGFLLGAFAGAAGVYWLYNAPHTEDAIDHDRDGVPDETRFFVDERLAKTEVDRNRDGRTDLIHHFDRHGLLYRTDSDEDFDGDYETRGYYREGNLRLREADVDGDGKIDFRSRFSDGVLSATEILNPETGLVRKTERYALGKRVSSRYDADADGTMDRFREYDFYQEPLNGTRPGRGAAAP